MSDIELALIFTVIIVIACFGLLGYFIYDIFPDKLWKHFKNMKEKEAEELKCQQFDREREEFAAWKSTQKKKSASPLATVDQPADGFDIDDDNNWAS
ncbi:MAG: hypothetical protein FWC66_10240 [Oscillospiraceae bacterium]|nr:hypothetical protein [Oscillospiraceae bacterium]